jgi:hypothetical protein
LELHFLKKILRASLPEYFLEAACFISLHAHQHSPHDAAETIGVTGGVISLTRDQGQIGIPFEMFERKTAGVWPD